MESKQRIVFYVRVSSVEQNVDMQMQQLPAFAASRGFNTDKYETVWYVEQKSTLKARPELNAMIDEIRKGYYAAVFVWKLDRLGRSITEIFKNLRIMYECNVSLYSMQDGLELVAGKEESLATKILKTVLAMMAEIERDTIRIRTREGIAARKNKGLGIGGSNKKKVVDASKIAEMSKEGMSIRKIAQELKVSKSLVQQRLVSWLNK